MGHNLHILVVNACSGSDALTQAETEVQDWGNEDNWRTFLIAIPAKGQTYFSPEATKDTYQHWQTLARINRYVVKYKPEQRYQDAFKAVAAGTSTNNFDWYMAARYCEQQHAIAERPDEFDVLFDSYNSGRFDEFGVTHLGEDTPSEGQQKWVVLMDMHS